MLKLKTKTKNSKLKKRIQKKGLIHVYTGNGKGKTTTALGLVMRAAGQGLKVKIIQFLKGKGDSGEVKFIRHLTRLAARQASNIKQGKINIESFGRKGLVNPKKLTKGDFKEAEKAMKRWEEEMKAGDWDLIILDEIIMAVKFGLTPLSKVLNLILQKPKNLELVLTGRYADQEIIKLADYVTEFKAIRHPYQKKIKARVGIEY